MNDEENNDPSLEDNIQEVADKFHIDIDWARAITTEEILYLINHCPFLQMINPDADDEDAHDVRITTANSGWPIHDYGDAISSSPGPLLYGGGFFRYSTDDDDDEGGGIVNPGKGTIIKQAFDTATQMIDMARKRGWKMVQFIDGHPLMERAAWIRAEQLKIRVEGFVPTEDDQKVRALVERSGADIEVIKQRIQPKRR